MLVNKSDLSMKYALDKSTKEKVSAIIISRKPILKKRKYICIGCESLPTSEKKMVDPTDVTHYDGKKLGRFYFRRKNSDVDHEEKCPYRNIINYIDSKLGILKIKLNGNQIMVSPLPLLSKSTKGTFTNYFSTQSSSIFFGFLKSLMNDFNIDFSVLENKSFPNYYVLTEGGEKVKIGELFYTPSNILDKINNVNKEFICILYGKVKAIKYNDFGSATLKIHTIGDDTKNFNIVVNPDYLPFVGNLEQLLNKPIACYGPIVSFNYKNNTYWYMELFSVLHQVAFLNEVDKELCFAEYPSTNPLLLEKQIERFICGLWGGRMPTKDE
ncbi:hypothetical protein [Peribacillus acanthi]|uniref:hypothetical protein n=1 Tax=Peribacillus acanthi TaxID=2171554 RepID=UPI000D3E4160|nr:hypothetical protein [Peribacillus acanthi]